MIDIKVPKSRTNEYCLYFRKPKGILYCVIISIQKTIKAMINTEVIIALKIISNGIYE